MEVVLEAAAAAAVVKVGGRPMVLGRMPGSRGEYLKQQLYIADTYLSSYDQCQLEEKACKKTPYSDNDNNSADLIVTFQLLKQFVSIEILLVSTNLNLHMVSYTYSHTSKLIKCV